MKTDRANIIPIDKARHREAQLNLPWYAAGELSAPEQARLEAHLAVCAECQADLQLEHRLRAEYPRSPLTVERDLALALRGLDELERRRGSPRRGAPDWLRRGARLVGRWWLGAAVAAQAVLIVFFIAKPLAEDPAYHTLGAAAPTGANIVVIFRPDAAERDMRAALNASDARLVDGPLASTDAYLIRVQTDQQAAALSTLRQSAAVASAEPIDADAPQ